MGRRIPRVELEHIRRCATALLVSVCGGQEPVCPEIEINVGEPGARISGRGVAIECLLEQRESLVKPVLIEAISCVAN
jgi:hypothetical protein